MTNTLSESISTGEDKITSREFNGQFLRWTTGVLTMGVLSNAQNAEAQEQGIQVISTVEDAAKVLEKIDAGETDVSRYVPSIGLQRDIGVTRPEKEVDYKNLVKGPEQKDIDEGKKLQLLYWNSLRLKIEKALQKKRDQQEPEEDEKIVDQPVVVKPKKTNTTTSNSSVPLDVTMQGLAQPTIQAACTWLSRHLKNRRVQEAIDVRAVLGEAETMANRFVPQRWVNAPTEAAVSSTTNLAVMEKTLTNFDTTLAEEEKLLRNVENATNGTRITKMMDEPLLATALLQLLEITNFARTGWGVGAGLGVAAAGDALQFKWLDGLQQPSKKLLAQARASAPQLAKLFAEVAACRAQITGLRRQINACKKTLRAKQQAAGSTAVAIAPTQQVVTPPAQGSQGNT